MKRVSLFCVTAFASLQFLSAAVRPSTVSATVDYAKMQEFSRTQMLPYRDVPFKGIVPMTLTSTGPLKEMELYVEFVKPFFDYGNRDYLFNMSSANISVCQSPASGAEGDLNAIELAELRFTGLENVSLDRFEFNAYAPEGSKYGIDYSLYNDGVKLADNIGSIVTFNSPFIAHDLKIVVSGFSKWDGSMLGKRSFRIPVTFDYSYYNALPVTFSPQKHIITDEDITLTSATVNKKIQYTLNGDIPTLSYGTKYLSPIGNGSLSDGLNTIKAVTFAMTEKEEDGILHYVAAKDYFKTSAINLSESDFGNPHDIRIMGQNLTLAELATDSPELSLDGLELYSEASGFSLIFGKGSTYISAANSIKVEADAEITVRQHGTNILSAVGFNGEKATFSQVQTARADFSPRNLFTFEENGGDAKFRASTPGTLTSVQFASRSIQTGIATVRDDGYDATPRYFNILGMEVCTDNITPGLYIVKRAGKSVKVIVK